MCLCGGFIWMLDYSRDTILYNKSLCTKIWHMISACSSLFHIVFTEENLWHNMHSFSMSFQPFFFKIPCYHKISQPPSLSSRLWDLASSHVVPVEVSRVWSRSHIHKVWSPELFKNITKSHTSNERAKEKPQSLSIQKSIWSLICLCMRKTQSSWARNSYSSLNNSWANTLWIVAYSFFFASIL